MKRTFIYNRKIWLGTIVVLVITAFMAVNLLAADELFNWNKQDTMDINFNIVENKAGDDDILLEIPMSETGLYDLTYYLEDGYQTYIAFEQAYDSLNIEYHINESDGAEGSTDVTQDLVIGAYLEVAYDLDVPDWEYDGEKLVGDSGGLEYTIVRSASTEYPGIAIEVDNKRLYIKWDFQEEMVYMLIKDYVGGQIMPVELVTPSGESQSTKILKRFEDFDVAPTHYYTTDGAFNIQLNPVSQPNDDDVTPGSSPGLDITFKQPKELNTSTWQYEYSTTDLDGIAAVIELEDVGTEAYIDFKMDLQNASSQEIGNVSDGAGDVNEGVVYLYDATTYTYTVHLVKDKSELAQQETFIEWPELAYSSIYDVDMGIEVDLSTSDFDAYEFATYLPENNFGYTYMAYELKRSSAEEAHLEVVPYNVGDQEEIEYTVLYSKIIKETLDIDEDLWLKHYHTTEDNNDEIFIPVPFRSTSSQDAYQVVVSFSGVDIYSQVLNYRAEDDEDVPPTTPNIELVDNLYVVPSIDESDTEPAKVTFDIVWTAPVNKEVAELDTIFENLNDNTDDDALYYELLVNDLPTDTEANPFEVVQVFQVLKDDEGNYSIELMLPNDGTATGSNTVNYTDGYNDTDELFRMDNVLFRGEGEWTTVLETAIDDIADTYSVTDTGEEADILFPGVNYMRIRGIAIKDGEIAESDLSVPISLSLSLQTYELPAVDTLVYEALYGNSEDKTAGVTLEWSSVDVNTYDSVMLSPIDMGIEQMYYRVFIGEDKDAMLALDSNGGDREIEMDNDYEVTIGGDDATELTDLRQGETLYFDLYVNPEATEDYAIDVMGLDANSNYYIRIITKVMVNDEPDEGNDPILKYSGFSSLLSVTVPSDVSEPDDSEIVPLAPEDFEATFAGDSELFAELSWVMPDEMTFEDDTFGFEILAIEDMSLPEDVESQSFQLRDVIEDSVFDDTFVEGWRMYVHKGDVYVMKYDPEVGDYVSLGEDALAIVNSMFSIVDDDNSPNRVNYYYIRSVKMSDTSSISASAWVPSVITTSPVSGPINLIVDYATEYEYDAKTEMVIRFDAPISDVSLIGDEYIMEIHVRGEDDETYSTTAYPAEYLGTEGVVIDGYERISYIITEMSSGKSYTIKVRIEDRTQSVEVLPDGSTRYPASAFSNIISSRTEFDQESYDKENKYYEYLEYYQMKADELKLVPFFRLNSSSEKTEIKYREDYATGLIELHGNQEWTLYSESNAVNTYYIPSGSLELINDENVTLLIESKDHVVGIRPDTVGVRITDEINDMVTSIEQYTSDDEDYYVRIRVYTDTYNGKVNGSEPSSDLVQLELSVVGSDTIEETVDDAMEDLLDTVIDSNQSDVIAALEEDLENGIDDASLLAIVQEVLEDVESEYMGQASILYKSYLNDNMTSITEVNKAYYIGLSPEEDDRTHDAYRRVNSSWSFASSTYLNNRFHVETTALDPYILVAQGDDDTSLSSVYGQASVDVINQYDLTSVFSTYDLERPGEKLEKYQWVNAVARLIGARAGEDTVAYLTRRGVMAVESSMYNPLDKDEALYVFAQSYAYKYNLTLGDVYITDYGIIEDMDDIASSYRQTLIQGANLGIIPLDDGMVYPKEDLTMEDALNLLTILHQGTTDRRQ